MKKNLSILLVLVALVALSCDLVGNKESNSFTPAKDIAITSVDVSSPATQGEIATVNVTVRNMGGQDISDKITISLIDQSEDSLIESRIIENGLARNDSLSLNYNLDTGNSSIGDHQLMASHNYEDDNAENDSLMSTLGVLPPDITDISITSITVPEMVTEGESIEVLVTAKNIGNQDISESIDVILDDETEGKTIGTQTISDGIVSSDSTTLIYTWDTSGSTIGDHTLTASLDFTDENSTNDTRSRTVSVNKAPAPDISIAVLEADPSSVTQGEEMSVSITVENVGDLEASDSFEVTLTDQSENQQLTVKTVNGLAKGNQLVILYNWDTDQQTSVGEHTLVATHNFDDENSGNDSRSIDVEITEPPVTDLAITSVNSRSRANQGDHITVSVNLKNQGNQDINQSITVTLEDQKDGVTIDTGNIDDGLSAGESATLEFTWDTDEASLGNHKLVARHDLSDDNSGNDSGSTNVTINEPPFFDLAVTKVEAPDEVRWGDDDVKIRVTLENEGNRDINETFSVTLINENNGNTIGTQEISSGLEEGNSITLVFTWNTSGNFLGTYTIVASHNFDDDNSDNNSNSTDIRITFSFDD